MSDKSVSLVSLSGNSVFEQLLRNIPEELHSELMLSPENLKLITAHMESDGTLGLKNRLPLLCNGSSCPFAKICVYEKTGLAPVGFGCPEEMIIIEKIVPALIRELQVDPESAVELDMIVEYVDAELQEIRAQKTLAIEGQTSEVVTAVDPKTGVQFKEVRESTSLSVKERAQRRKSQFRKDFLATREQRTKYKTDTDKDASTVQSEKLKIYEELKRKYPDRFTEASYTDDSGELNK